MVAQVGEPSASNRFIPNSPAAVVPLLASGGRLVGGPTSPDRCPCASESVSLPEELAYGSRAERTCGPQGRLTAVSLPPRTGSQPCGLLGRISFHQDLRSDVKCKMATRRCARAAFSQALCCLDVTLLPFARAGTFVSRWYVRCNE